MAWNPLSGTASGECLAALTLALPFLAAAGGRPGTPTSGAQRVRRALTGPRVWAGVLLLLMAIVAAVTRAAGIETLLSPETPPPLFAGLLLVLFLVTCVIYVLVPHEAQLVESRGRWVMFATHVLQAGFFSAVFLFLPLPGVALRFLVSFLMAGGHWRLGVLLPRPADASARNRDATSLGQDSGGGYRYWRSSVVVGLALGIVGSVAIVAFVSRTASHFNPLAAKLPETAAGSPTLVADQSRNLMLAVLWASVAIGALVFTRVRNALDRRHQGPRGGIVASASAPTDVTETREPSPAVPAAPFSEPEPEAPAPPEGPGTAERIRELLGQGDVTAMRFDRSVAGESVLIEFASEDALRSLTDGAAHAILRSLPDEVAVDLEIRVTYFSSADAPPHFKKTLLVRRADRSA